VAIKAPATNIKVSLRIKFLHGSFKQNLIQRPLEIIVLRFDQHHASTN
jgi:hypothetical protein